MYKTTVPAILTLCAMAGCAPPSEEVAPSIADAAVLEWDDAVRSDARLIAEQFGWDEEATVVHLEHQKAFGELAFRISEAWPESFSASLFAPEPGGTAVLRFRGEVPEGVHAWVEASGVPVEVLGGEALSFLEKEERVDAIAAFLQAQGVQSFTVAHDPYGVFEVGIGFSDEVPEFPAAIAEDVEIVVDRISDSPIELMSKVRGSETLTKYSFETSRCTSGFNVEHLGSGKTGVTTAAHCDVSTITSSDGTETLTLKSAHLGQYGDVRWALTPATEVAMFWARATEKRAVESQANWISTFDTFCIFGRASAVRTCSQVRLSGVMGTVDGVLVRNVAQLEDEIAVSGDSGATFSYGTQAAGIAMGSLNGRTCFTKAKHFDEALNVEVRTK